MTKTFTQYLIESEQTYKYRIKIAGFDDKDRIKEIEEQLGRYDIIKMTEPKITPVMQDPLDFPGIKNMEVCTFEVELAYPAGQQELFQMLEMISRKPKRNIKIVTTHFAEGWDENEGTIPNEDPAMLENDYPEETKAQKEAKSRYHNPADHIENPGDATFEVAGGDTPDAETTNDLPQGKLSPLGSTKNDKPEPKSSAR